MKPGIRKLINFLFIGVTIALVCILAFGNSDLENAWEALFTLDPWWLLGAAGGWFSYLFFDALGYHYFLRKQGYEVKLSFALYISLMGFYYSNITPGASGGQPMQIYYMNKKGVPIGIGTSGISMKFISNQLMTVLMASALWLWNASFVDRQLAGARWVVVIGWLINFAAVPLILLVAFHRPLVQRIAAFFIRLARSERRTRFFLHNLLFLLLSIPYLNLVDWFSLELARGWAMLIGLTPLLRGFLALYIIVAWLARNRFNQLLAAYLFSVLVFTYLASLVFYDYEILVNPRLADYGDALWWAWMNVTTVGAAIFPVTAVGKVVCVLLPIVGMIFFPIFTVYISQYYTGKKSSN